MIRRLLTRLSSTSTSSSSSSALRVPAGVVKGTPDDVRNKLPLLYDLSDGAKRGIPRWVDPPTKNSADTNTLGTALLAPPRKRSASWLEITYPFSTDVDLRTLYMLADGTSLRAGRFLEELDAFAADCSVRHAVDPDVLDECVRGIRTKPIAIATVAHDGLSIFSALSAMHDFRLRGAVVSVGTTSMEVRTDVLQVNGEDEGEGEVLLGSCYTIMVARDPNTFDKAAVAPLTGGTECADFEAGARMRQARRKALRDGNLKIKPPMPDEVPILHEIFREAQNSRQFRQAGDDEDVRKPPFAPIPMNVSRIRNLEIMQPKNQNRNGHMFGGYLLRRALEAAWLSAYKHTKHPMVFAGMDDVTFGRPVEVGKIVEISSRVAFVDPEGSTMRVFVDVNHISLKSGRLEPRCEFHFVFVPPEGLMVRTPQVQPVTYAQTLMWLESRRRWLASSS